MKQNDTTFLLIGWKVRLGPEPTHSSVAGTHAALRRRQPIEKGPARRRTEVWSTVM
jgi:hypothetical protein